MLAGLAWMAILALPIYVLGFANRLTAPALAVLALLMHLAILAIALGRHAWRSELRELLRFFVQLGRAPLDLALAALRGRSLAFFGVLAAAGTLFYCAVVSWYAPSFHGWDPLWYHEPIVALTIQNHGFAHTVVPDSLQRVNGYPRLGEMLGLWFVIFTDRRLIELPSVFAAGLYLAAIYTLARRFGATRTAAAGWSTGLLFIPAVFGELQSTMIDLQLGAFAATAFALGSRRTLRARDALAVVVAGALAINTKYLGVVSALSIAAVVSVRLVAAGSRIGHRRVVLTLSFGTLLLGAAIGITLVRNYLAFRSPFWPHELEITALHYKSAGWPERGPNGQVGLTEPWSVVFDYLFASPAGWAKGDVHDGGSNYGLPVPWVLLPCALLALPLGLWQRARRIYGAPRRDPAHAWDALRLLAFPLACEVLSSPATWAARYQLATLSLLVGLAAAVCSMRPVFGETAAGAFLLLTAMTRHWSPEVLVTRPTLASLMKTPYPRREVADSLGAPIVEATGLAREHELGPGDVVVVSDNYGNYPALLWNNRFENRVVFLRWSPRFFEDAAALNPTWIFLGDNDPGRSRALAAGWQEVGNVSVSRWGKAYRRP